MSCSILNYLHRRFAPGSGVAECGFFFDQTLQQLVGLRKKINEDVLPCVGKIGMEQKDYVDLGSLTLTLYVPDKQKSFFNNQVA
jgi:hypothetical protein